ncbi:winged helix domain-containing protein [Ovoidimarina sediminis]|uniref:winged helix domain-containing protein n=1 Tax=Ovoidimarina sediminis TaxID=3079856 RepID=UPI002915B15D|nr:hypothetical protein [Rhodophyticola sp. MJ-SS7]MDU8946393.1 hypothetical protein [Rhodophyticola sp. MJ-SS7]
MQVIIEIDGQNKPLEFAGRNGLALFGLIAAGDEGITTNECPSLRWANYVETLRCRGVAIETQMEGDEDDACGRYRLACAFRVLQRGAS